MFGLGSMAIKGATAVGKHVIANPISSTFAVGGTALAVPQIKNDVAQGVQQHHADVAPFLATPETYMPKMSQAERYIQKLAAAGHLDAAAIQRVRERVDEQLGKEAAVPEWVTKKMLPALGTAALAASMPIITDLASQGYDAIRRAMTKGRDFKAMMAVNPDLKKIDTSTVQKHFNVLHRFSPELASDPTVAAAWIKQTAQFDEVNMNSVRDLIGTRKSIQEGRPQVKFDWQGAKALTDAMNPEDEKAFKQLKRLNTGEGLDLQRAGAKAIQHGKNQAVDTEQERQQAHAKAFGEQSAPITRQYLADLRRKFRAQAQGSATVQKPRP